MVRRIEVDVNFSKRVGYIMQNNINYNIEVGVVY